MSGMIPWDEFGEIMRKDKQRRNAEWKRVNTEAIIAAFDRVEFKIKNNGETLLFREPGKPKVDFFPSTGRWLILGKSRVYRGGALKFIEWYRKQEI